MVVIENNNPGNIRKDKRWQWQGEPSGTPPGAIISFDKLENGTRAMLLDLNNKIKAKTDTISKILYKWAPPEDNNDTEGYIKFVSNRTGIGRDVQLQPNDLDTISRIALQMTFMEHKDKEKFSSELEYAFRQGRALLGNLVSAAEKKKFK